MRCMRFAKHQMTSIHANCFRARAVQVKIEESKCPVLLLGLSLICGKCTSPLQLIQFSAGMQCEATNETYRSIASFMFAAPH